MSRGSHHLNAVLEKHGSIPTSTSFRKPLGSLRPILLNLCENIVCSLLRICALFLWYCSSSDVHASSNEREAWRSSARSVNVARAITRVTDDGERSVFKTLFLLVLKHTVDDELEGGYPFVTDVGGRIASGLPSNTTQTVVSYT